MDSIYCPYCGSVNEKGNKFCSSCGANLTSEVSEEKVPETEYGYEYDSFPDSSQQSESGYYSTDSQSYAYGAATDTQQAQPRDPTQNYSQTALIMAILGFFCSCFLFPIIGLSYVKKAEQNNENPSSIKVAKIILWIEVGLWIVGIVLYIISIFTNIFGWY
ncbi:MAG: zinc-ribbon domain-containing protein [Asgard group archaeon]|nr:zinc-ribbon domain-containing protein [Asgard group archaeon]